MIYYITCGSMKNVRVNANTVRQAVDKAIKLKKPKYLALLAEAQNSKGMKWYIDSLPILHRHNFT